MSVDEHFQNGKTWEDEVIANALRSKKHAWIIAILSLALAIISATTLLLIFPLKTVVPYVITVDKTTGNTEITKELYSSGISEDKAVTESNLVKYISGREQYNVAVLKENYELISLMSGKTSIERISVFMGSSKSR